MKRLKSNTIGVDKGSAHLFSDYEIDGPMWIGEGSRIHTSAVRFSESFKTPPTVHISMEMWDTHAACNQRMELLAEHITIEGFSIIFKTWSDTKIARARASWLAIGELSDDDDWDVF